MLDKEKEYYSEEVKLIVGLDEAGRGPLAGPVVAAAVVFDPSFSDERINDSKQLNEKKREELYDLIIKNALAYAIELADVEEIDKYNILEGNDVLLGGVIPGYSLIRSPSFLILSYSSLFSDG